MGAPVRAQRLLLIAFALSLIVHAIVALRIEWPFRAPHNDVVIVDVEHRPRVATIVKTTPTPPPHTPAPAATPAATAAPVHAPKPAKTLGTSGARSGGAPVVASPVPTPAPTPIAAASACTKPEANAALVTAPTPPDLAPALRANATNAIVRVAVKLDERGTVTEATVAQSSGNGSLDLVAISMARNAQYAPAYHDCKAIAGSYNFSARFIPW